MTILAGEEIYADDFLQNHTDPANKSLDENKGIKLNSEGLVDENFIIEKGYKKIKEIVLGTKENEILSGNFAEFKTLRVVLTTIAEDTTLYNLYVQFNGDTGNNYGYWQSDGGSQTTQSGTNKGKLNRSSINQNYHFTTFFDIENNINFKKAVFTSSVAIASNAGVDFARGNISWNNLIDYITSIKIFIGGSDAKLSAGTILKIYGLK